LEREPRKFYNSSIHVNPQGEVMAYYDKVHLVPFGEYMPFENVISLLGGVHIPGHFERGDGPRPIDSATARFAFLICYEAIVGPYVRGAVNEDVELLVNLTFDAWYGDTSELSQHLMLAATQSAQFGLPLVRSTTTGISAVVDPRGLIVARTGVDTREVLVDDVKVFRVPSPYTRIGDGFAWACVIASLGLLVRGRR
jgi:apolipoprotein N-acyltransferase